MKLLFIAAVLIVSVIAVSGCISQPAPQEKLKCAADSECVPATCCHANSTVNIANKPDCTGAFCTLECRGGTLDCGCGTPACINGQCSINWNGSC